jgi:hypothetical protein
MELLELRGIRERGFQEEQFCGTQAFQLPCEGPGAPEAVESELDILAQERQY